MVVLGKLSLLDEIREVDELCKLIGYLGNTAYTSCLFLCRVIDYVMKKFLYLWGVFASWEKDCIFSKTVTVKQF